MQQSWSDKMTERVRNVIKRDCKKLSRPTSEMEGTPVRKKLKGTDILRRYPTSNDICSSDLDNPESMEKHMRAISSELAKAKPRDTVLLPLMKSTFAPRRLFVLNDADSVNAILQEYPALSRPAVVSRMNLRYSLKLSVLISRLNRKWG